VRRWLAATLVCAACSGNSAQPEVTDLAVADLAVAVADDLSIAPDLAPACPVPARNGTFVADSCPPPPAGRIVAGADLWRVVANYDNCPAFVDGSGLWAVDENGNKEKVVRQFDEARPAPHALVVRYDSSSVGTLAFWSRATGTVVVLSSGITTLSPAAIDDHWIAFLSEFDTLARLSTLAVAPFDCSGVRVLGRDSFYNPLLSGGRVLASVFPLNPPFNTTTHSYDPLSADGQILFTDTLVLPLRASRAGAVLDPNGGVPLIYPAGGGAGVPIGGGQHFYKGAFTHAGDAVIYNAGAYTQKGALVRAPIDGSAATILVPDGADADIDAYLALSPDDQWMVYSKQLSNFHSVMSSDAWLTSAKTATTPQALLSTATLGNDNGVGDLIVGFTDDSAWVYWNDAGVYYVRAVAGDTPVALENAHRVVAAGGARLVWDDGSAVWSIDLGAGALPSLLAQFTDPMGAPWTRWTLSLDKKTVYYLEDDGLYAAPVP
jgi:hypothetical protein